MKEVLRTPWHGPDIALYSMFREVVQDEKDRIWLRKDDIRYDITVIPPMNLCGEWVKTYGHFHPDNPSGTGYPEIYEVLHGRARYLLQHREGKRFIVIPARKGQTVLIPPGFGHVTVNPGAETPLVMANLVSNQFSSEYGEFGRCRGASYYLLADGTLEKNPRYPHMPFPEQFEPHVVTPPCLAQKSLYDLVRERFDLGFLNNPENYPDLFPL